jgi:hypothetical protein
MAFHTFGIFVLFVGIFLIAVPYIFKIDDFVLILFWTILGLIVIKIAIFWRDKLRLDKL